MKKDTPILIALALLTVGVLSFTFYNVTRSPADPREAIPSSYTMQQVAAASTTAKCWVAIDDSVYDLTPFTEKQQSIRTLCGTNATEAVARFGGDGAKTFSSLRIGDLEK